MLSFESDFVCRRESILCLVLKIILFLCEFTLKRSSNVFLQSVSINLMEALLEYVAALTIIAPLVLIGLRLSECSA